MNSLSFHRLSAFAFVSVKLCAAIVVVAVATAGCGDTSGTLKPANTSTAAADSAAGTKNATGTPSASGAVDAETTNGDASQKTPSSAENSEAATTAVPDDTVRKPATVEEARRALDLTKFPLPEGAERGGEVAIAHVGYKVKSGDVKSALDYVRKKFTEMGWKEVGETHVSEDSAYCTFGGKGFHANVQVYKDQESFKVSISNHGNVNLAKLPVPPNAKLHHSTPTSVAYFTEQSPDEAREAVHKLLIEQGWTPYGNNLDTKKYKQNAVELSARAGATPAFDNKTMISYHTFQMSADLPAPPQMIDADYTDYLTPPKQLLFETAATRDELYQFYRDTLAKDGWEPTTENPITDEYKAFMIFRNKAKDLMEVEAENAVQGRIRGKLKHQSADEYAEIERQIEADRPRREAEAKKEREEKEAREAKLEQDRKDREAAEKARRRVVVAVPAGAKDLKFDADDIKFGVARGKARAAAEAIAKQFRDGGWTEGKQPKDGTAGTYSFKKDDQSIHIHYLDPGVIPPEVRVSGFRVDFERAAEGKK